MPSPKAPRSSCLALLALAAVPRAVSGLACSSFDGKPDECKGCTSSGLCTYDAAANKCAPVDDPACGPVGITALPVVDPGMASGPAFSTDDACPETTATEPVLRTDTMTCEEYSGKPSCCPAAEESQATSQVEPAGLLTFLFKDQCLARFKQVLCAQVCHPEMEKYTLVGTPITEVLPKYEGIEGAPVGNLTFFMCESFCTALYGACKDVVLASGQTVQAQYDVESFCEYLSSDAAVSSGFAKYTLAPLGSKTDNPLLPKGPYQNFKMVRTADCKTRRCWTPPDLNDAACGGTTPEPAATSTTAAAAATATTTTLQKNGVRAAAVALPAAIAAAVLA